MNKLIVFLTVLLFVIAFASACTQTHFEASALSPESSVSLSDTDRDGMNDWFEKNIAGYDPDVPNDRYIIFYYRILEDSGLMPYVVDSPTRFFIEKGKVPPENIVGLAQEEANNNTLKSAIEEIAKKSDKNDLVFLRINAHGSSVGFDGDVEYTILDGWLDKIEAKAVVAVIMACGSENALPILKDGPCPRIVFVYSAGEFIGMLGANPEYAFAADTKYGNNDGYVSLKELGDLLDYDPFWGNDRGGLYQTYDELYAKGRNFIEAEGYSKVSDTSNVASKIYLTDYCYRTDFKPDLPERQAYNWIYYKP